MKLFSFKKLVQTNKQRPLPVLTSSEALFVKTFSSHGSILLLSDISILTLMSPSDVQFTLNSLIQKKFLIEKKGDYVENGLDTKVELTTLGKKVLYALTNVSAFSRSIIVVDDIDRNSRLANASLEEIEEQLSKEIFKLKCHA